MEASSGEVQLPETPALACCVSATLPLSDPVPPTNRQPAQRRAHTGAGDASDPEGVRC